jgi:hypothetical protein
LDLAETSASDADEKRRCQKLRSKIE